jgi:hypothetical protein
MAQDADTNFTQNRTVKYLCHCGSVNAERKSSSERYGITIVHKIIQNKAYHHP